MSTRNISLFLILWQAFVRAQLFVPDYQNAFNKEFAFNKAFIKDNQIRKIIFEIIDKKDYQVAVDKSLVEYYEFNRQGYLARYYYTDVAKTYEKQIQVQPIYKGRKLVRPAYVSSVNQYVYDTIGTVFLYGPNENLLVRRFHDGNQFYEARYYTCDSSGNSVKECRYRETNVGPGKSEFVLGNQVLISADSMNWIVYSPNQTKVIYFNNEGRPYKEKIILSNDGLVTEITEHYTAAAWIQQVQKFEYDDKRRLISATYMSNANSSFVNKITYEYDTSGWLLNARQYKNDELLTETGYVNDYKANMVNSLVIRDFVNQSIRIIKLKYALFDTIQTNRR